MCIRDRRRARFETLLRASGNASMALADARTNEYLARRAQENVEGAAAAGSMAGGYSSSPAGRAVP
eukprot:706501-Alexandrium_andersonii.AAC.1